MKQATVLSLLTISIAPLVFAHEIQSPSAQGKAPAFDTTSAAATTDGRLTTFTMEVAGVAGNAKPVPFGQLSGAKVESYVWPTSFDPSAVGFDRESGTLALAITAHPDYDDTPLFDEDGEGNPANDGAEWHSHWIVLVEDDACEAKLKVRDISPGVDLLPATAPYLPIALDSPGMSPLLDGRTAKITVPVSDAASAAFDAVTAELRVNVNSEEPLLCLTRVHDVASGDLSLPGRVIPEK